MCELIIASTKLCLIDKPRGWYDQICLARNYKGLACVGGGTLPRGGVSGGVDIVSGGVRDPFNSMALGQFDHIRLV